MYFFASIEFCCALRHRKENFVQQEKKFGKIGFLKKVEKSGPLKALFQLVAEDLVYTEEPLGEVTNQKIIENKTSSLRASLWLLILFIIVFVGLVVPDTVLKVLWVLIPSYLIFGIKGPHLSFPLLQFFQRPGLVIFDFTKLIRSLFSFGSLIYLIVLFLVSISLSWFSRDFGFYKPPCDVQSA